MSNKEETITTTQLIKEFLDREYKELYTVDGSCQLCRWAYDRVEINLGTAFGESKREPETLDLICRLLYAMGKKGVDYPVFYINVPENWGNAPLELSIWDILFTSPSKYIRQLKELTTKLSQKNNVLRKKVKELENRGIINQIINKLRG